MQPSHSEDLDKRLADATAQVQSAVEMVKSATEKAEQVLTQVEKMDETIATLVERFNKVWAEASARWPNLNSKMVCASCGRRSMNPRKCSHCGKMMVQ